MTSPSVDPTCASRWKFNQASATAIQSGFYSFGYGGPNQLAMFLSPAATVVDMSSPDFGPVSSPLWYYHSEGQILYNWGWKASLAITACTDPSGRVADGWNGAPLTIESGGTIYSPSCTKFLSPTGISAGTIDLLHLLPSSAFTVTIQPQAIPQLPVAGTIPTNTTLRFLLGSPSTYQKTPLYLSVDGNGNLIGAPDTGYVDWTYGLDKSLNLNLGTANYYLADIPLPQDITSDGTILGTSIAGAPPAAWTIPKLDYSQEKWPFPDYSQGSPIAQMNQYFGASSSFLLNDSSGLYLTFQWDAQGGGNIQPRVAVYPSPQSFSDIIGSVNVSFVNLPPQSIGSGLYYIQTADGGQCLQDDLGFGDCSWDQATWNYDASAGSVAAVKGGVCLASTLDQSCLGSGQLQLLPCSQADQFILGTNGEMFLSRCAQCYSSSAQLSGPLAPSQCGKNWAFTSASSSSPGGSNSWLRWLLLILGLALAVGVCWVLRKRHGIK